MFNLQTGSRRTSVLPPPHQDLSSKRVLADLMRSGHEDEPVVFMLLNTAIASDPVTTASGRHEPFVAQTAVNSLVAFSKVIGTELGERFLVIDDAEQAFHAVNTHVDFLSGPPAESGAAGSWVLASGISNELTEALAEIRQLASMIRQNAVMPPGSDHFDQMLAAAVQKKGVPANLDQWARHLAAELGDLDD